MIYPSDFSAALKLKHMMKITIRISCTLNAKRVAAAATEMSDTVVLTNNITPSKWMQDFKY